MVTLHPLIRPIVNFALPPRCPTCGVVVAEDHQFCQPCWEKLNFLSEPYCASCGIPLAYEQPGAIDCAACLERKPDHDGVRAAVQYDDHSRQIALKLKYAGKIGLAELIARNVVRFMPDDRASLLLVPVPLHRRRIWTRSFNQAALIAHSLGRLTDVAVALNLLKRTKQTPPLHHYNEKQRRKIVRGAFWADEKQRDKIAGKRVILIDDVYTTGATANACALSLKAAGAQSVNIICWARVIGEAEI